MFKSYPANYYLRIPVEDLLQNLSPEFKGHLRCLFGIQDLKNVELQFGSNKEVIIHYQGEK